MILHYRISVIYLFNYHYLVLLVVPAVLVHPVLLVLPMALRSQVYQSDLLAHVVRSHQLLRVLQEVLVKYFFLKKHLNTCKN